MVTDEPELLKPVRLIRRRFSQSGLAPPEDAVEVSPMFINGQRVPSPPDVRIQLRIVKFHASLGDGNQKRHGRQK